MLTLLSLYQYKHIINVPCPIVVAIFMEGAMAVSGVSMGSGQLLLWVDIHHRNGRRKRRREVFHLPHQLVIHNLGDLSNMGRLLNHRNLGVLPFLV